jgi:hypothetical protein
MHQQIERERSAAVALSEDEHTKHDLVCVVAVAKMLIDIPKSLYECKFFVNQFTNMTSSSLLLLILNSILVICSNR